VAPQRHTYHPTGLTIPVQAPTAIQLSTDAGIIYTQAQECSKLRQLSEEEDQVRSRVAMYAVQVEEGGGIVC
jgi:hypothetical protein